MIVVGGWLSQSDWASTAGANGEGGLHWVLLDSEEEGWPAFSTRCVFEGVMEGS